MTRNGQRNRGREGRQREWVRQEACFPAGGVWNQSAKILNLFANSLRGRTCRIVPTQKKLTDHLQFFVSTPTLEKRMAPP